MSNLSELGRRATCPYCAQVMDNGVGCEPTTVIEGIEYRRRVYGFDGPTPLTCHDCHVARGQVHHAGCDMERCPRCEKQAITCDCDEGIHHAHEKCDATCTMRLCGSTQSDENGTAND